MSMPVSPSLARFLSISFSSCKRDFLARRSTLTPFGRSRISVLHSSGELDLSFRRWVHCRVEQKPTNNMGQCQQSVAPVVTDGHNGQTVHQ